MLCKLLMISCWLILENKITGSLYIYFVQYIVLLEYAVIIMISSCSSYHVVNNIYTLIIYNDRQYVLILV
jgi:hypothetical protein